MNVDDGSIRPWDSLTAEEQTSGRWVQLTEDEHAMAELIDSPRRSLKEMFKDIQKQEFEMRSAEKLKRAMKSESND